MKKKTFAVIGLGKFGYAVAETLAKAGYEVLAAVSYTHLTLPTKA